jgi:hypothetical protein
LAPTPLLRSGPNRMRGESGCGYFADRTRICWRNLFEDTPINEPMRRLYVDDEFYSCDEHASLSTSSADPILSSSSCVHVVIGASPL